MIWRHYTERIPVHNRDTRVYSSVIKHTFAIRLWRKDLVLTWCWC